ncbi:hypothetical protein NC652_037329 [Populus alba x Populus x berolinensis]|nr:hypothetical protein NC652_037329 [Populus alba x Populus x berolinensis]
MDRFLIGQGFDDEIFQLLKVACNCLDCIPDRRPSMFQVYKDIKAITKRSEVVDDSEIQMLLLKTNLLPAKTGPKYTTSEIIAQLVP